MKLIIVAGVVALAGTLIGTRAFIGFLVRRGYGQFVRDDGPATHSAKRGTPTMGGLAIVLAVGSWAAFVWGLNLQFQVWPSFISG